MPRAISGPQPAVQRLRAASERNAKALALRPSIGQGTAVTRVRLGEGCACSVEEGPWKFTVDMSEKAGGENRGPNPGILGRAALGACLAIGYAQWAARMDIAIHSLEIEVQADYDSRAMYGVGDVEPGYREIRYIVHIQSPEPEETILRLLDQADRHSDFLYVFRSPQRVTREVRFNRPED
jgi:uncharacterized OsmC-like protein